MVGSLAGAVTSKKISGAYIR